jgi:hypothetical protein
MEWLSIVAVLVSCISIFFTYRIHKESLRDKRKEAVDLKQQQMAMEIVSYLGLYLFYLNKYREYVCSRLCGGLGSAKRDKYGSYDYLDRCRNYEYYEFYFGVEYKNNIVKIIELTEKIVKKVWDDPEFNSNEYNDLLGGVENIIKNLSKYIVTDIKKWED